MKKLVLLLIPFLLSCSENEVEIDVPQESNNSGFLLDQFQGSEFVVYTEESSAFYSSYSVVTTDGETIEFDLNVSEYSVTLSDKLGGQWDRFGKSITGPHAGKQLMTMNFMMGYWFAISAFYPKVTLFNEDEQSRVLTTLDNPDWTINANNVFSGATKDGIPSIDNPKFIVANPTKSDDVIQSLDDEDLVIVTFLENSTKVFPVNILNYHEIVNFSEDGRDYVLSYCPLTGTGGFWDKTSSEFSGRFGVSGLLYNNNLILYDQATNSYWSQIKQQAVYGELIGTSPTILPHYEMTYGAAKQMSLEMHIMSEDTGVDRPYNVYPYGDYRTNDGQIGFPLEFKDDRLPAKERVMAVIINNSAKIYRYSDFSN